MNKRYTEEQIIKEINQYLFSYYNRYRPRKFNGGVAPAEAEKKLTMVSGFS